MSFRVGVGRNRMTSWADGAKHRQLSSTAIYTFTRCKGLFYELYKPRMIF